MVQTCMEEKMEAHDQEIDRPPILYQYSRRGKKGSSTTCV